MIKFFLLVMTVSAFAQNTTPCPNPDEITQQAFIHIQKKNQEEFIKLIKANPQLKDAKNRYCERLYHYAIRGRNEEARKFLDKQGFGPKKKQDINERFDDRQSYFTWALMFGLPSTYDDLKKRGGKVEFSTEIHMAVRGCNNSGLITHLVSKGVDVNKKGYFSDDAPPLYEASKECKFEIAEELLKHGAKTTSILDFESPLLVIIKRKVEPSWIEAYLKAGADLSIIYKKEVNNYTALMVAAKEGTFEAVKLLIDYGSDINSNSIFDGTALSAAIEYNSDPKIIELLLERGANPNIPSEFGAETPFHEACANQPVEILDLLVKYGADVSARTGTKANCLHRAAMRPNSIESIKWIGRKLGPKFDYGNQIGTLPSHFLPSGDTERWELIRKIETGQAF
jgi:ankyrin repeat protein